MKYPAFDNHVHLQRKGRFLDAVREFKSKGGTGFALVALPPDGDVSGSDYFTRMYEEGVALRAEALTVGDLEIVLAVGPYPVTLLHLSEAVGIAEAESRMIRAAELAGRYVSEGRADAIGEVGRPHFEVDSEALEASNRIMQTCMSEARSAGCPVILHTEDPSPALFSDLSRMADATGIERSKVVKHHCTDAIAEGENMGIFPSVKATRDLAFSSARKGRRFVLETDYIDDPARPGAFLGIGTVPRRVRELVESGLFSEDDAWKIGHDNPFALYGESRLKR